MIQFKCLLTFFSGLDFMLIELGVNCLVDEPNLYNLYKIENILILFIALVLYH